MGTEILIAVVVVVGLWLAYQLRRWLIWLVMSAILGVGVPGLIIGVLVVVAHVHGGR